MCSAPKVSVPKYEAPPPIEMPEIEPGPTAEEIAATMQSLPVKSPQQASPLPPPPPPAQQVYAPAAPAPVSIQPQLSTPPPALMNAGEEVTPIVKRRKSKRQELQQASSGTDALRIPLSKGLGVSSGGTGSSSGLNIPK